MRLVLGTQAYAVPASTLEPFLEAWGPPEEGRALCLALDEADPECCRRAAERVDLLMYSPRRSGFGAARRRMLLAGRLFEAETLLLCDGDGQYEPRNLAPLLDLGGADAAIPQRDRADLPLAGGRVHRGLAEAFEAWCVAHGAGRPEEARRDLQPGAFVLGPRARLLLEERARTASFAWDLEASRHLLASGLEVRFPPVAASRQRHTSFTAEDSAGNLASVAAWFGRERVLGWLGPFLADCRASGRFPGADLEEHASRVARLLA